MHVVAALVIWLVAGCTTVSGTYVTAKARGQKRELEAFGQVISSQGQSNKPDWTYILDRCADYCTNGAYYLRTDDTGLQLSGDEIKSYLSSLQVIDDQRAKCIRREGGREKVYETDKPETYAAAISCLKAIDHKVRKPQGVDPFYFDSTEVFGAKFMEPTIADLERRQKRQTSVVAASVEAKERNTYGHPIIPSSSKLMASKGNIGTTFYVLAVGKYLIGREESGSTLDFQLVVFEDSGDPSTGRGNYAFTCNLDKVPKCSKIADIFGMGESYREMSGAMLITKYTKTIKGTNDLGHALVLPLLEVIEVK
jgi:hypothetical protein